MAAPFTNLGLPLALVSSAYLIDMLHVIALSGLIPRSMAVVAPSTSVTDAPSPEDAAGSDG